MTSHSRYLREGIIGGLIGATIVAVWFLIYDAARGAPFRTPALLGAAAFQGAQAAQTVPVSPGLVVQYTVLHGVVFALIAILAEWLFEALAWWTILAANLLAALAMLGYLFREHRVAWRAYLSAR